MLKTLPKPLKSFKTSKNFTKKHEKLSPIPDTEEEEKPEKLSPMPETAEEEEAVDKSQELDEVNDDPDEVLCGYCGEHWPFPD